MINEAKKNLEGLTKLRLFPCIYSRVSLEGKKSKPIDLKNFEMPIYNGDLEEISGLPENAIHTPLKRGGNAP